MASSSRLSFVIPVYNEEDVIETTLTNLVAALEKESIDFEIICANNCSKDKSADLIRAFAAKDPRIICVDTPLLQGYGIAVRTGLHYATGEAVVIYMADGSDTPADAIGYFRMLIEKNLDCVFGSRFMNPGSVKDYPKLKMYLNRAGNFLLRLITQKNYDDFTNGFKCYRRDFLRMIGPFVCQQFNLTIEMSLKAIMAGGRFGVMPNSWQQRDAGQSKFAVFKQSVLYLSTLLYLMLDRFLKKNQYEAMRRQGLTF